MRIPRRGAIIALLLLLLLILMLLLILILLLNHCQLLQLAAHHCRIVICCNMLSRTGRCSLMSTLRQFHAFLQQGLDGIIGITIGCSSSSFRGASSSGGHLANDALLIFGTLDDAREWDVVVVQ